MKNIQRAFSEYSASASLVFQNTTLVARKALVLDMFLTQTSR